jgi:hypothetical protein
LWSIQADTLEGLTAPLTFNEGRPATKVLCWYGLTIKDQAWISPDAYKLTCIEPG